MTVEHLFNSSGAWIAYRVDQTWVWSSDGKWIGWCPWPDDPGCVVTVQGKYLGHIVGDRLLRKSFEPYRGYPGYPGHPGHPGYPGYPGFAGYARPPLGMSDVPNAFLQGD
jgi:hypothetical protein